VTSGGKQVNYGVARHPSRDPSGLVDDSTRWAIVAAILLDGPDPAVATKRTGRAAQTRERKTAKKNANKGSVSDRTSRGTAA